MNKMKILRKIKPKVKSVKEINRESRQDNSKVQESNFQEDSSFTPNRSSATNFSPTLERRDSMPDESGARSFTQTEREQREESTRFYESVNNRQQQTDRLKYESSSQSQIIGEVGMASARASVIREEDLFDKRNSLISRSGGINSPALNSNTIAERNYELREEKAFEVKRRKEAY